MGIGVISGDANLVTINAVQPGNAATFYVSSVNVGVMSAVTVRTVGSGSADKWGLGSLDVYNGTTSATAAFEWGKYVAAGASVKILKTDVKIQYEVRDPPSV